MPDAEFAVRELLREQVAAALRPRVPLSEGRADDAVDAIVEAVASLMPFDVGRAAAAEVAGLQLGRTTANAARRAAGLPPAPSWLDLTGEPDALGSRHLLDRAVGAAEQVPDAWAPHVWAQLAAAAVAVERGEREHELHEQAVERQRRLAEAAALDAQLVGLADVDELLDDRTTVDALITALGTDRAQLVDVVADLERRARRAGPWRETIAAALEEPDNVPAWVQALVDAVGDPGALLDVLDGNDVAVPPWLVDGLQAAAAERETLDAEFVQPPGPDSVPDWVVALVDAAAGGRPLDFAGAVVPAWVQERLERGVADGTLGTVPAGGTS